jgi:hypothetical protein
MSEVPITSYLQYLHEVSRRIIQRGGFDCIPTNAKQPLPCSLDNNEEKIRFLSQAREIIKDKEKGLFVGFGLVSGKTEFAAGVRRQKRRLLAPILFASAELEDDNGQDQTQSKGFDIDWDTYFLNIDLLTLLLTGSADYNPEEDDDAYFLKGIPKITLDKLAELENQVDKESLDKAVQKDLLAGGFKAIEYLNKAKNLFDQAPKINICHDFGNIKKILKEESDEYLTAYPVPFLFFAPIPNQLSTTIALHKLHHECEDGGLKSELLNDLMIGALTHKNFINSYRGITEDQVEQAIEALPMPLSESQRRSICDAWTHRLSYVQGPPGTGKSHTITAMMLTAILLGQRVLMVSHKPAAVAIVRKEINKRLGATASKTIVVEASPMTQNRQAVRQLIQEVISEAKRRGSSGRICELQNKLTACEKEVSQLKKELTNILEAIRSQLEQEKKFYDANEQLIIERQKYIEAFEIDESHLRNLPKPPMQDIWQKRLVKAHSIIKDAINNGTSRANILSLKRFYKTTVKHLHADSMRLGIGLDSSVYLDKLQRMIEMVTFRPSTGG